ncbi:MAG: ATP-binding protein [bacterium]|jgi:signal transduction histidine kinase
MLSLPDLKSLVRSINSREDECRRREGNAAAAPKDMSRLAGLEAFMVEVAVGAHLDLVALLETDARGKSAGIVAASRSGLTSLLSVPSLEDRGPLAKLIREDRPRGGKGKILISNEVFPRDGNWCELIPMDSSVAYFYQPLTRIPVPGIDRRLGLEEGTRLACLAVSEAGDGSEQNVEVGALLAASLVANLRRGMDDAAADDLREERVELLRRLTSSIAHEIKNPLTGISAGVQYLARKLESGTSEEETVDFILTEINRLNRIIDDLYSVSRPPTLIFVETDVADVINKSLLCLSEEVLKKEITTAVELDKSAPPIKADPDRLQQVFINVIKNAVEACYRGGKLEIVMTCSGHNILIEFADDGCGIPCDEIDNVFEPFHSNKSGGTGLGLYLSRSIVERHRGTIGIAPGDDGGTVVTVNLPIRDAHNG